MSTTPLISVIMPSYLGDYPGAAADREKKFRRAVRSFYTQAIPKHIELVIVSDGCDKTIEIVENEFSRFLSDTESSMLRSVQLIKLNKQSPFSGAVRNVGIQAAKANIICYLDTDDVFMPRHLDTIAEEFNGFDWVYWNDCVAASENFLLGDTVMRGVSLGEGTIGTSNVAHQKNLPAVWGDGYGHDWRFIQQLMILSGRYKFIPNDNNYVVCHVPGRIDV
jgi:glycosyltransferase involved in cell wall biosynthesis